MVGDLIMSKTREQKLKEIKAYTKDKMRLFGSYKNITDVKGNKSKLPSDIRGNAIMEVLQQIKYILDSK